MAMNKYLYIITLNINGLNAPIKRHRIVEWIRKHDPHICCLQDTHCNKRCRQTESEELGKKYSKQMDRKKRRGGNTYIRQYRCQINGHKKRHIMTLHNSQGKNPSRRHKYCKHI